MHLHTGDNRSTTKIWLVGVSALTFLCTDALIAPLAAQAPQGQALPPVVVVSPNQTAPAARPTRRTQQQSASRARRTARQPTSAQTVQTTAPVAAPERANGPVTGVLAMQSATSTKTDTSILETPQSVSVVTQDQISQQGAQRLTEALRYTPGVQTENYGSSVFFDYVRIRGLPAHQYLDGLRLPSDSGLFANPRIDPYGLERIEVLKGPSSGLFGQTEPGGLINMISKRPQMTPHFEMQGSAGSFNRYEGAFDFGGPVAKNSDLYYRLVGLYRNSDAEVNFTQDNKIFIAPSLTYAPSVDTKFTILSSYSKIDNKGYQQYVPGELTLPGFPYGRLPRSTYLGEPGLDSVKLEQASIGYAFEHRFNEIFEFRQNLRYMTSENTTGAFRGDGFLPPSTVYRSRLDVLAKADNIAIDNQLQANFKTGALRHTALLGLDYQTNTSSNSINTYLAPVFPSSPYLFPIDALNPAYGTVTLPPLGGIPFMYTNSQTQQKQTGVYLQDQIKLDKFTLTLTGRNDWAQTDLTSSGYYPPAGSYQRSDSAPTYRAGLNYLFDFGLSPYINYSTSFVPNTGADQFGRTFKPTTGEGKEIGLKYMPPGTNIMFTAAWFDIGQKDVLNIDPTAVGPLAGLVFAQTDDLKIRGFEFEAKGNLTPNLAIVAGYSKLDPRISKSILPFAGNYAPNVNLEQAMLWGKYSWFDGPLAGLGVGAGVRYSGVNYGDQANTIRIPAYTLFDATLSYDLGYLRSDYKGWLLQVNATNLTDEYYVSSCLTALSYCGLGSGRTVVGTVKYSWK